jgi:hypothetical protein
MPALLSVLYSEYAGIASAFKGRLPIFYFPEVDFMQIVILQNEP